MTEGLMYMPSQSQSVAPSAPPLSLIYEEVPLHDSPTCYSPQFSIDACPLRTKSIEKPYNAGSSTNKDIQKSDKRCYPENVAFSTRNTVNLAFRPITPPPDAVDDEPDPSAPPLELMDKVQGYEGASFECVEVPPPLVPALRRSEDEPERAPLPEIPHLTEKEVREALLKEVRSHCCFGSGTAKDMAVTDIKHSIAFHYTLETFTEKRMTCWSFAPYTGGTVDGPSEPPPFPWDVQVTPPKYFQSNVQQVEVPHTASVKTCHVCGGVGRKRCTTCSGAGWEYCFACHGDGRKPTSLSQGTNEQCFQCHGTGRRRCWKCNGDGMAFCKSCGGTGQIKCFICLTVVWTNHLDDFVVDRAAAIEGDRLKTVTGEVIFQEEQPALWPLNHFPDSTVNLASVQLIQQHADSFVDEKVLMQRHRIRVIPIAAVSYRWKNHSGLYHVYGYEQKVYAPDYPQTCCCCVLL